MKTFAILCLFFAFAAAQFAPPPWFYRGQRSYANSAGHTCRNPYSPYFAPPSGTTFPTNTQGCVNNLIKGPTGLCDTCPTGTVININVLPNGVIVPFCQCTTVCQANFIANPASNCVCVCAISTCINGRRPDPTTCLCV